MKTIKKIIFICIFNLGCTGAFHSISNNSTDETAPKNKLPLEIINFEDGFTETLDTTNNLKLKTFTDTEKQTPITGRFGELLVSLWRFNNEGTITDGDNIFTDSVGGHTGKAVTPGDTMSYDTGVFNEGISLNGTSDFVRVNDHTDFQISGALTISAWAKPTINQDGMIIQRGRADINGGYELNLDPGIIGPIVKFRVNSTATTYEEIISEELIMNKWNHIVGVFVPGEKIQIYLNGSISDEKFSSVTSTMNVPAGEDIIIGYASQYGEYFAGSIDEAAIWKRPLSPGEVKALYHRGTKTYSTPNSIKELPNHSTTSESLDMSDNALLMHFDDYKLRDSQSITDYSGNNNHGSLNIGAENDEKSWISPLLLGLKLDGTNDNITIASDSSHDTLDDFTLSVWIYPEKVGEQYILSKNFESRTIFLSGSDENSLQINACVDYTTSPSCSSTQTGSIKYNQWQHVVMRYSDSTNKTVEFFINGVKQVNQSETSGVGTLVLPTGSTMYLGSKSDGTSFFGGILDELSIWNRVLTEQEIKDIFKTQSKLAVGELQSKIYDSGSASTQWKSLSWTPLEPYSKALPTQAESGYNTNNASSSLLSGIIMHYKFDESSGTTFIDQSSSENHGSCTVCPNFFKEGLFNGAQEFSPVVGQAINLGNNTTAQSIDNGNFSFSVWVYPRSRGGTFTSDTETHGRLFDKDGGAFGDGFYLTLTQSAVQFVVDTDSTDLKITTYESLVKYNQWNHIAFSWNGGLDPQTSTKIYINGAEAGYKDFVIGTGSFDASGNDLFIGAGSTEGTHTFDGYIDEVIFWNRILTDSEVLSLYKRGANKLLIQKRICDTSDCSDKEFTGPNDIIMNYYSETLNSSLSIPSLLNISIDQEGRYFQYRIFMDSLHYSTTPELTSITIE